MQPPNLNKTERKAWEWLRTHEGYDADEIRRSGPNQVPDFICPDESYEAKRPSNQGKFTVGGKQADALDDHDPVIIIIREDDDEPRGTVRWSEVGNSAWTAHVYERDRAAIRIETDRQTKSEWKTLCAKIDPDADDEEIIHALHAAFEREEGLYEKVQTATVDAVPEFRGPS